MRKDAPQNLAASVRQRLQNLARQHQEDFQLVLGRFALERLLCRIWGRGQLLTLDTSSLSSARS